MDEDNLDIISIITDGMTWSLKKLKTDYFSFIQK